MDVDEFTRVLLASRFDVAADMNEDGVVNGLDVEPFVAAVVGAGVVGVPEPSTFALVLIALVAVGLRRMRMEPVTCLAFCCFCLLEWLR